MLEYIVLLVAIVALFIASYTDIKYGTISDKVAYPAIVVGVSLNAVNGLLCGDLVSAASGIAGAALLFGFGYVLWWCDVLGGGDVRLFAAIGALLPNIGSPPMFGFLVFPTLVICFGGAMAFMFYAKELFEPSDPSKPKKKILLAPFMLVAIFIVSIFTKIPL